MSSELITPAGTGPLSPKSEHSRNLSTISTGSGKDRTRPSPLPLDGSSAPLAVHKEVATENSGPVALPSSQSDSGRGIIVEKQGTVSLLGADAHSEAGDSQSDPESSVVNSTVAPSSPQTNADGSFKVNRWGLVVSPDSKAAAEGKAKQEARARLELDFSREKKWMKMLAAGNFVKFRTENFEMVKRRIRKGIPDSYRTIVWPLLCGADDEQKKHPKLYSEYSTRAAIDEETAQQIHKDKKRTMQQHVLFRSEKHDGHNFESDDTVGQSAFFRVLNSYALYNPVLGYCQGMAASAAIFVSYLPEEQAFWLLERVLAIEKYGHFGGMFEPGFPLLFRYLHVHDRLLEQHLPKLAKHLADKGVSSTFYGTRWYTTVFSGFPPELFVRIWDCFLAEGPKILFRMALCVLKHFQNQLLSMDEENLNMFLQHIHQQPFLQNADEFLAEAFNLPIRTKDISRYDTEFRQKQKQEQR